MTPRTPVLLVIAVSSAAALPAQTWRAEADAAIREHRMAPLTVNVSGAGADDATVHVYQTRQAFYWGTNVRIDQTQSLETEGVPVGGDHPYFQHLLDFNSVTPGNAGKWKFWERAGSREQYREVAAWLRANGVQNRGHTPIWPSVQRWDAVPADVRDMTDSTDAAGNVLVTKNDRIRRRIREHLTSYMRAMTEWGVYEVDLVNELYNEPDLYRDVMGLDGEEIVAELAQWHIWAHEAAPDVALVANDYNPFQAGGSFGPTFGAYVRRLIDAGAPITRIGMQGHFFTAIPTYGELQARLDRVSAASGGLPMSVTEYDMADNSADGIERALYAVFAHPDTYGFTVWGAWDGLQWRNNAPIYYGNWRLKPNGRRYVELVRERWHTDTTFAYGASAKTLDVFHGDYAVTVERADGTAVTQLATVTADGLALDVDLDAASATPLPAATLVTGLADGETVLTNRPLRLSVATDAPVEKVAYYVGDVRQATRYGEVGAYDYRVPPTVTYRLGARVTFESGYVAELSTGDIDVDLGNSAPQITRVLPGSGYVAPQGDSLYVEVLASDRNGDPITGQLLGAGGEVVAEAEGERLVFLLEDVPEGFNRYRLVVEDDRFGRTEVPYVVTVPEGPERVVTSVSSPLRANDDTEEREDGTIDADGDIDLGQRLCALRFFPQLRPQAEVAEARIQFVSQKSDQDTEMVVDVRAERAANPSPLSTANGNVSRRNLTEATVRWDVTAAWDSIDDRTERQRTPDLSALVREVAALDGFTSRSPLHFVIGVDTAGGKRSAYSVDQSEALAPVLTIRYPYGPSLAQDAVVVDLGFEQTGAGAGVLEWDISGPFVAGDYYEVYLEGEAPRLTEDAQVPLDGLEADRDYTATVRAVTSNGGREARTTITFRLSTSSLSAARPLRTLTVAPSPARERVTIAGAPAGLLTVVDALGRVVAVDTLRDANVDFALGVGRLGAGVYRVVVTAKDGTRWRGSFVRE